MSQWHKDGTEDSAGPDRPAGAIVALLWLFGFALGAAIWLVMR